jgi:hypothetical protein
MRILLLCILFYSQYTFANFDWSDYSALLKKYVQNEERQGIQTNLVDYSGISEDPSYSSLLDKLAVYDNSALLGKDKLAFYINTYNIFAIKLVIDHQPKHSIKDIGSWFNPVWQKPAGVLNGQVISLDTIEHKILRKMSEPRIHFAIVCASLSCPDLRIEPYVSSLIDIQLNEQANIFINNSAKGIEIVGENIYISKIFDWFSEDFSDNDTEEDILKFIAQYQKSATKFSNYKTLEYNWKLNRL